jgi:DNA-binding NtrC family response regulator
MKTILMIDDDVECAEGIAQDLNKLGHAVIAMQDGPSALSLLKGGMLVDLVITDCQVQGMSGIELLAAIRKAAPMIPTIMVASSNSVEMYLKALSAGVFEYLTKPVKAQELCRIVKKALEYGRIFDSGQKPLQDMFLKRTA